MRVVIHPRAILEHIPELVPAFREYARDIPDEIEIEAALSRTAEFERHLRAKYPDYWMALTTMEWLVWVSLNQEEGGKRSTLTALIGGEATGIDKDNASYLLSNVTDVHVKNLRKKLYALGNKHHIRTKRAWGYILTAGPTTELAHRIHEEASVYSGKVFDVRKSPKKVTDDGRTIRPNWRPRSNRLNPVEFGYLKEMIMDEIPKETAAKRLHMTLEEIEVPWNCRDFDEYYSKVMPLGRRWSFRGKRRPAPVHDPA